MTRPSGRLRARLSRLVGSLSLAGLLAAMACRAESTIPVQADEPAEGAAAAASVEDEAAAPSEVHASVKRVVAIGDVHGDLRATRDALRLAGAIDAEDRWAGGDLIVVQTGDQLDRGDDEQEIVDLFSRLVTQADEAGGRFVVLNGNHEIMNATGDFRYVTPGGWEDFADLQGLALDDPRLESVPEDYRPRVAAFVPGGPYAKVLAERDVIAVVEGSVFVHGGVLPEYAAQMESINAETREWLRGEREKPPEAVVHPDGPVWSRHFSDAPDDADCELLAESLKTLNAERMVVGHTVDTKGIRSACEGRVWMIDVGMAAYYGGKPAVLEIDAEGARPLNPSPN